MQSFGDSESCGNWNLLEMEKVYGDWNLLKMEKIYGNWNLLEMEKIYGELKLFPSFSIKSDPLPTLRRERGKEAKKLRE